MIEAHISPGCAWSIWKTKGGIQPTLESLDIPREFLAKFKLWKDKWCSDFYEPNYIGRNEYDVEGRKIAGELQQAVGDRFHIVFCHWVAFDPKRWQTQWREENLITGALKKFWLVDFLPDDIVAKVVKIYPDYASAYLWDLDGCNIGNDNPVFSDDLDSRFRAWSDEWDACCDYHTGKIDKPRLTDGRFDERGLALAAELKRAVGESTRVIYCCTLSRHLFEPLEGDKISKWPWKTNFRQWALDQRSTEG